MSIAGIAREKIRALRPYEAAVQVNDTIRLNANEAPWTSSGDHFRRPLNRYPKIRPQSLRLSLANRYDCAAENLMVTRGSSEAIDLLTRIFCDAGKDTIVAPSPSFSMYRHYATVQGVELREVATSPTDDFAISPDSILNACDATTKLVFLCSPNNPTGTLLNETTLRSILDARLGKSAVVVDEAYIEFSGAHSAAKLLPDYDNLLVLRTLSKALAYAGARCGAVIGPVDVINMIDAVQAPYAFATPVIECVEDALQAECLDEADNWVKTVVAERERLAREIGKLPFVHRVWPSAANFFLVQVRDAAALMRKTSNDGVLLRYFSGHLSDCVRITIGTREDNDRLLRSMRELVG